MRFRFRYKAGWTAFIFIFALAGVILTFRQWNENKEKDKLNKFMPHDNLVHHDNNVVQSNQVLHPPLQDEQDVVQRLPKQMVPNMDPDVVEKIKRILTDLDPQDWGQAKDADEMALDVKTELSDLGYESPLSCKEIDALRISSSLKVGKKKYVDRAYANYPQSEVVLKSQAVDQSIKIKCMQKFYDADKCHVMGNYFLIREIVLMSVLKHPSIINLLGYCLRGDNINYELKKKGIILVTEPGRSVELSTLSMQNWADRLMYALQLAELLNYLEHSPLGSLGLVGIRADDFVLVDRHLKLSDLDDLRIEEPACRSDDECHIPGVTNSRISCDMGRCKKRNAKANLQRVGPTVFEQLLRYPPNEISDSVGKLRQKILTLEITAEELVQSLKKFSSAGQDDSDSAVKQPVFPLPLPTGKPGVKVHMEQEEHNLNDWNEKRRKEEIKQNRVLPELEKQLHQQESAVDDIKQAEDDDGAVRYVRFDQHNFPGIFDYSCQNSRVVWGCVMTVRSLKQAKEICNKDHNCKSFVLFTSNPDLDVLMTMVAKNSAASKPEPNVGATLFVKSDSWSRGGGVPVYNEATGPQKKAISYQDCYKKMINVTKDARFSREKRLMAHLGLKGLQDKVWRKKVKTLTIVSHKGVNQLSASTSIGGRFNVQLGSSKSDKRFNNAIFMSEIGPTNYHIAHMIVYKLDRLLGVYHTPPSVIRTLSKEEVEAVKGDAVWSQQLHGEQTADGIVTGLLTAAMPKVVKKENLMIKKLDMMVEQITSFTRQERMQLEYVFLLALTKSLIPDDKHWGYKGHLIHFGADQAFEDQRQNMIGYFYHCQFPNVIYKALSCFKCHGNTGEHSSSLCSLGQEVIKQVLQEGYQKSDIVIYALKDNEITITINDAASTVYSIVDQCIKKFGREKVLY